MVRTILCRPVTEIKVFSEYYDPLSVCCIEDGTVVVGAWEGTISVHRIDKSGCPREHVISTVGSVTRLLHCVPLDYILTLEVKHSESRTGKGSGSSKYVRVYLNWRKLPDGKYLTTHKIGYTESSYNLASYAKKFLVLDIPMKYAARDITCCQSTGNIAVATESRVNIYACKKLKSLADEASEDFDLIDFFHVAEIDPGIQLINVSLSGRHVAFSSTSEMQALEISCELETEDRIWQAEEASLLDGDILDYTTGNNDNKSYQNLEYKSKGVTLDNHFMVWNLDQGYGEAISGIREEEFVDSVRKDTASSMMSTSVVSKPSLIALSTIVKETPYVDVSTGAKEITGPKEQIFGHPIKITLNQDGLNSLVGKDVKCSLHHTTLLYKRLDYLTDVADDLGFHSLQWLPVFLDVEGKSQIVNFMAYPSDKTLIALGLFISSQKEGFLYDALYKTRLLAVYNYTATCTHAKLTINSLYSITTNGLETYTVRLYPSATKTCKDMAVGGMFSWRHNKRSESYSSYHTVSEKRQPLIDNFPKDNSPDAELQIEESYYGSYIDNIQRDPRQKLGSLAASSPEGSVKCECTGDLTVTTNPDFSSQPYPIYHMSTLLKPCPSCQVEICLIGLYQLRGLKYVGCTSKHVVLLVKAFEMRDKRGSLGLNRKIPWNVYVLERTTEANLARDLIGLIDGSEFANPMVYHQLLAEAIFLTYSALTSTTPLVIKKELSILSRELAVRAGDFFARCSSSYNIDDIAQYYSVGGLSIKDVLSQHVKRDKAENLGSRYGPGIIKYLNEYLFEMPETDLQLNEEEIEYILKLYALVKPSLLCKVLQESKLEKIPNEYAVEVLESFRNGKMSSNYSLSIQDLIALIILYLKLCNPDYAELVLKSMKPDDVVQVSLMTPSIVVGEQGNLSPFAQLLQRRFPGLFTLILKKLIDHDKLCLEEALEILGIKVSEDKMVDVNFNPMACEFLENVLNDGKRESDYLTALDAILPQYKSSVSRRIIQDFGKSTHRHVPKGNGLYAARYDWLDLLPPFGGEISSPNDCVNRKQGIQAIASYDSTPRSSPVPFLVRSEERQDCSCCCCQNVLLKLQSILSSDLLQHDVAKKVLSHFGDNAVPGMESLLLLCWPRIGETRKVADMLIKNYTSLILQYTKDVIKNDKEQLQVFASTILHRLRNNEYEQWNRDTYLDALKGIYERLARLSSPTEFLTSLPQDGALKFFLPYIRDCLQAAASKKLGDATLRLIKSGESSPSTTHGTSDEK